MWFEGSWWVKRWHSGLLEFIMAWGEWGVHSMLQNDSYLAHLVGKIFLCRRETIGWRLGWGTSTDITLWTKIGIFPLTILLWTRETAPPYSLMPWRTYTGDFKFFVFLLSCSFSMLLFFCILWFIFYRSMEHDPYQGQPCRQVIPHSNI